MRAALLTEARPALRLDTVDDPSPGPGEVVLKVDACGICGSDLHVASAVGAVDAILGHEIAGTIEAVGPDVDRWSVGQAVVPRPITGCFSCDWCDRGRPDHCDRNALLGLERPGGFAEYVLAPQEALFALPASVTGIEQALVEPLAVARRTLRRVDLRPGEDLLVLGGGPVGLAVVAWARTMGAGRIVVSEPVAVRRELAVQLGADGAVDPRSDDLASFVGETLGSPPPVVVECSGVPGLIGDGIFQVGIDGRVGVVGICLQNDTFFPWFGIQKEVDVRFSLYYGPEDFTDTIDGLDAGRLDAAAMITETVTLDQLPARFAQLVAAPDAGKVIVTP